VQGRRGLFKHQSLCHQPFPQSDLFLTSEFGLKCPPVDRMIADFCKEGTVVRLPPP
jgi:hypothetical protein